MRVSELGEFGLIARLAEEVGATSAAPGVIVGIGDDAAVVKASSRFQIATTDTMVADVHFRPGISSWQDTGWKALASNVSDIAAMGGVPEFALVTLCLPDDFQVEAVDDLYRGLLECGAAYGVSIVGGDIVRAPTVVITVALTGYATIKPNGEPALLRRSGAQVGDAIAISGFPGDAAGGLRLLLGERPFLESEDRQQLVQAHLRPRPRLELSRVLVEEGVDCAIDVSDGLAQDLAHICEMSRLGAVVGVDRIAVSPALVRAFPSDALDLAIGGGEDYELLFTAPLPVIHRVQDRVNLPITIIGEMVRDEHHRVRFIDEGGEEVHFPYLGWNHFRRGTATT